MNKKFESYFLAKTWKRITARLIDILIVSCLSGIIVLISYLIDRYSVNSLKNLIIMLIINYIILIIYFLIIPWKFNGKTLGKIILLIRMVNENNTKINFKSILLRETFLVFVPVTLASFSILLSNIFLKSNINNIDNKTTLSFWISVLIRICYSFIFAWYLGIIITIKIDKKHQLFYDRKFNIYIINKHQITNINTQEIKNNNNIIHFQSGKKQPGQISQKELDEIKNL